MIMYLTEGVQWTILVSSAINRRKISLELMIAFKKKMITVLWSMSVIYLMCCDFLCGTLSDPAPTLSARSHIKQQQ